MRRIISSPHQVVGFGKISSTDEYLGKQINKIPCQKPANIHSLMKVTGLKSNDLEDQYSQSRICPLSTHCPGIPQAWHPPYARDPYAWEIKRSERQGQSIFEHSEYDLDHGTISEDRQSSSSGRLEVQAFANKPRRMTVCNTPNLVVTHRTQDNPTAFKSEMARPCPSVVPGT